MDDRQLTKVVKTTAFYNPQILPATPIPISLLVTRDESHDDHEREKLVERKGGRTV